jgi:hypothetical protein
MAAMISCLTDPDDRDLAFGFVVALLVISSQRDLMKLTLRVPKIGIR